jgi:hypothetical protein
MRILDGSGTEKEQLGYRRRSVSNKLERFSSLKRMSTHAEG